MRTGRDFHRGGSHQDTDPTKELKANVTENFHRFVIPTASRIEKAVTGREGFTLIKGLGDVVSGREKEDVDLFNQPTKKFKGGSVLF